MDGSSANRRYSPAPNHKSGSSASPLRHQAAHYWIGYPAPAQSSRQGTSSSSCDGPGTGGKAKRRASDAAPHRLGRLRLGGFFGGMMLGLCLSQWLLSWLRAPQLQLQESGRDGRGGRGSWWGGSGGQGVQGSWVWGPAVALVETQCAALMTGKRETLHAQARGERDRWEEECRIEVEFERKRARLQALGGLEALRATARGAADRCQAELSAIGESAEGDVRGRIVGRVSGLQGVQLIDSKLVVEAFFPGMAPFAYGRHSLLVTTPGAPVITAKQRVIGLQELSVCGTVEVVMVGSGRCYALTAGGGTHPSRWLHKFAYDHEKHPILPVTEKEEERSGGQGLVAKQKRKQEQLEGWSRVTRIPHEGKTPPTRFNAKKHEERFLKVLLSRLPELEAEGRRLLAPVVDRDTNLVVAMAVTQGDLDTLVNLACSMAKRPSLHPAMGNVMVFAGDDVVVQVARSLGFHAMAHPAFGELPTDHAVHYGDAPFLEVMWLKSMAAWLVNRLGYHVLFQDADVVWFQDPRPMLLQATETGEAWREGMPLVDSVYMDDGARSERFGPYFMNSGFFFFRHNHRTTHLLQSLLWVHDMVIQWASHQTSFIQAIELHHVHYGLTFRLLDRDQFPGGRMFHHEKEKLQGIHDGTRLPYIFHMNWCQYKFEKLQFFKEAGMWYVDDERCSQEQIIPPPSTSESKATALRGAGGEPRPTVTTAYCCSTRTDHV